MAGHPASVNMTQLKRKFNEIDDSEDLFDESPPYQPDEETMPDLAIFSAPYREAKEIVVAIFEPFQVAIEASNYTDSVIAALLDKINKCKNFERRADVKIGLAGDSGVGKSSLLNCLLGEEGLAVSSDLGGSCTNVVQSYGQASSTQEQDYQACVELMSKQACKEYLHSQARRFIRNAKAARPHNLLVPGEDVDGLDRETQAEHVTPEDIEADMEVNTTIEILTSLFPDAPEFRTEKTTRTLLTGATDENDTRLFTRLDALVDELWSSIRHENSVVTIKADDIDELNKELEPYTMRKSLVSNTDDLEYDDDDGGSSLFVSDYESLTASYWPIVRSVHLTLHNKLLDVGLTLVDLPGMSDTNRHRVKTTQEHLRRCSHHIVVGDIKRIETDTSVHKYLSRSAGIRKANGTTLVCTSSDLLESNTTNNLMLSNSQRIRYTEVLQEVVRAKKDIQELDARLRAASKDLQLQKQLLSEKQRRQRQKKQYDNQINELQISARNTKVSTSMRTKWGKMSNDAPELHVYCVSNKEYKMHLRGFDISTRPTLSVEGTGIPALRQQLLKLPANVKYRVFKNYCKHTVSSVLNCIDLSCALDRSERKDYWMQLIDKAESKLLEAVRGLTEQHLQGGFSTLVRTIRGQEFQYTKKANQLCEEWFNSKKITSVTFKAFMRRQGYHKAPRMPQLTSMNKTLLSSVQIASGPAFVGSIDGCRAWSLKISTALQSTFQGLIKTLKDDPTGNAAPLQKFYENIDSSAHILEESISDLGNSLIEDLSNIHDKAVEDTPDSYFVQAMGSFYEKAATVTGPKPHEQRKNNFQSAFAHCETSPFKVIASEVDQEGNEVLGRRITQINEMLQSVFMEVKENLKLVCHKITNDSPEGKKLCADLKALVEPAREKMLGRVLELIKECDTIQSPKAVKAKPVDPVKVESAA